MDEPLSSLDAARKEEVLPFIAKLPRAFSIPILYVTHSVDEIRRLADRLVLMEHGRSIATGGVGEMMSRIPRCAAVRAPDDLTDRDC
jgi:molybdate transport system ATP-binding protein